MWRSGGNFYIMWSHYHPFKLNIYFIWERILHFSWHNLFVLISDEFDRFVCWECPRGAGHEPHHPGSRTQPGRGDWPQVSAKDDQIHVGYIGAPEDFSTFLHLRGSDLSNLIWSYETETNINWTVSHYRNTQDSVEDNNNVLQLNLVLNNLIICVLVKSFEEMTVLLAVPVLTLISSSLDFRDWR